LLSTKFSFHRSVKKQLTISTALAGAILSGYGARKSYAGDCSGGPNTYTCSGAATGGDTAQILSGAPLTVTTTSGFGISTATGTAFDLTGSNGLEFNDSYGSDITGATFGIDAGNTTNSLSITTTGHVEGVSGYGIYANNSGIDLTINAASVTGNYDGINAANNGSGVLSITTTGHVEGASDDGIFAINRGTNLTINAASATGRQDGIHARNLGSGALSVTATGYVQGTTGYGDGIYSVNNLSGTDLTIDAAGVTGEYRGIQAVNLGSGALSVTASGAVEGTRDDGLIADNSRYGTELTVDATAVTGGEDGIWARNRGTGVLSITATGDVTGASRYGISATNQNGTDLTISAANVTGYSVGVVARSYGTGYLSIDTTNGTVTGDYGPGLDATNFNGTNLTVTTADVSGSSTAMYVRNFGTGTLSIDTTSGTVEGSTVDGIVTQNYGTDMTIETADVSGSQKGIYAINSGSGVTSVTTTGDVTGSGNVGIFVYNAGTDLTIDASGAVTGYSDAIAAINQGSGALSITSAAATATYNDGIYARNYGTDLTVVANGAVSGGDDGISANNYGTGATSVTTYGTVNGVSDEGIDVYNGVNGTSLAITANGDVTAYQTGIQANNYGSAGLSITANGDVTSQTVDGIYGYNSANDVTASMVINQAAGTTTTGARDGIYSVNYGGSLTINANGITVGQARHGINAFNGVTATDLTINAADASGDESGIYAINIGTGNVTVTSTGVVSGSKYSGVFVYNTGTDLTIDASGAVSGYYYGVSGVNRGSGALSITTAAATATHYDGVFARNFGTDLTVVTNGTVSGADDGISANNYGTGAVSVTTHGTVDGTNDEAIDVENSAAGTSLTIVANDDVTAYQSGIQAINYGTAGLSITVNGNVTSQSVDGIYAYNGTSGTGLTIDAMTVTGGVDGIDATNYGSGVLSVTVGGSVQGGSGVGVQTITNLGGTTLMVVENGAIIGATSNEAISNNEGDSDLTFNSGSAVNGAVRLNDGSDVLTVVAGADVSNPLTVLDGGDDSSIADGYIDQLYLSGTQTLTGANIINWENVIVAGGTVNFSDNALTVGADNGYGLVIQSGGTLAGGNTFALTGNLEIASGGTFSAAGGGTGAFSTSGSVSNRGTLSLADGAVGDSFTVNGDFEGGGVLDLDVDQASQTADTLIIAGDVTGGTTTITVNGFAEDGNDTDILLVDVTGASDASDFAMTSIVDGAFAIGLEQASNDWYLRNIGFSPNTPIYQTYPQVLLSFSALLSFHDRFGDPWGNALGVNAASESVVSRNSLGGPIFDTGPEMWGYISASHSHVEASSSTVPTTYDLTRWSMRTGYKSEGIGYGDGQLVLGASFHYGKADASITSAIGGGSVDAEALGFGVSATWIGDGGFYADGQLEGNRFSTDLSSDTLGSLVSDNSGHGYTASFEVGKRFALDDVWSITPQGQLTHSQVYFDAFTSSQGTAVSGQDGSATELRIGAAFGRHQTHTDGAQSHLFGITNIYVDTASGTAVNVASTTFYDSLEKYSAEIGLGGSYSKNGGLTNLYGSVTARTGLENFGQSYAYTAKIGVAFQF
jgi:outer membrane autotransporter protein